MWMNWVIISRFSVLNGTTYMPNALARLKGLVLAHLKCLDSETDASCGFCPGRLVGQNEMR